MQLAQSSARSSSRSSDGLRRAATTAAKLPTQLGCLASRQRIARTSGKLAMLLGMMMVSACASRTVRPEYKPSIPSLTVAPHLTMCLTESGAIDCVTLATDDFRAVVRELKACCLALGHSLSECGAEK